MIKSLLVANRGEIACRIFRTARRLGIRTVAVYSDADAGARHVRAADEAVRIGPAPARESYLDIGAHHRRGARAAARRRSIPATASSSENAAFRRRPARDAGLVFVGPPAAAIRAMGSKIVAKTRMQRGRRAGAARLRTASEQDLAHLAARGARASAARSSSSPPPAAAARACGSCDEAAELAPALAAARRLAESAFGDGALLLERYLPAPRHIEVQVFADTHGNFVHLGERDCSIQRRHQKVIEEAPAPACPSRCASGCARRRCVVARAIGYVSAGTVEFLVRRRASSTSWR